MSLPPLLSLSARSSPFRCPPQLIYRSVPLPWSPFPLILPPRYTNRPFSTLVSLRSPPHLDDDHRPSSIHPARDPLLSRAATFLYRAALTPSIRLVAHRRSATTVKSAVATLPLSPSPFLFRSCCFITIPSLLFLSILLCISQQSRSGTSSWLPILSGGSIDRSPSHCFFTQSFTDCV